MPRKKSTWTAKEREYNLKQNIKAIKLPPVLHKLPPVDEGYKYKKVKKK